MLKTTIKFALIALFIGGVAIQFAAIDKTNPEIDASQTLAASTDVPPDISLILGRSCNDCHSYQTIYPWYAHIQPSGWFLKSHIDDGRRHLNFSVWNTYDNKKKARKLEEICDEVSSRAMPLPSYLWIHGDAALQDTEIAALCEWTQAAIRSLEQ